MFKFFKVLFKAPIKKKQNNDAIINDNTDKIEDTDDYNEINNTSKLKNKQKEVTIIKKHSIIEKETIKPSKQIIKEINMADIFLVVIDTTGRAEAQSFKPGLQNFYFVVANDDNNAKDIVLSTFHKKPHILAQLQYATKVTRLSAITKNMGENRNFWTYVPMGGQRAPGQQAVMPSPEQLLRPDEYGNMSSRPYTPSQPIAGEEVSEEELKRVQFSGADSKLLNKLKATSGKEVQPLHEEMPPMSPELSLMKQQNDQLMLQNQQMMQQMANIMSQMNESKPGRKKKKDTSDGESV